MSATTYPPSPPTSRPSSASSPKPTSSDPVGPTSTDPTTPATAPSTPHLDAASPAPAPSTDHAPLPPLTGPSPATLGGVGAIQPSLRREDLEAPTSDAWGELARLFPDIRRVDVAGTLARAKEAPLDQKLYDRIHALTLEYLADRTERVLEDAGLSLVPAVVERIGARMAGAKEAVQAAEAVKESGNTAFKAGAHNDALGYYLEALSRLWPWTGTTMISYDLAAAYGITKLEQALCLNIALVLLNLSPPPRDGSHTECRRLAALRAQQVALAVEWCDAVIAAPYVTAASLKKALLRRAEAVEAAGGDGAAERARAERVRAKDAWAHTGCVTSHVCC
ncbi:hypothetical protein Q5752_000382 [Cryptotrichosporon argae]